MISRASSGGRRFRLASGASFSTVWVWMTCTVLSPLHATNSRPSGASAMSLGRMPTGMLRTRRFSRVSTTLTLRLPQLLT